MAIIRFFSVNFVSAYGFSFSRYVSAFVDFASLPVVVSLLVCIVFYKVQTKIFKRLFTPDFTGFILISLIPVLLVCAIRWGTSKNPLLLVLVPVLWSATAVGFYPLFTFIFKRPGVRRLICGIAAIAALPCLAAAVWWQFFIQENLNAFILLFILLVPAILTICFLMRGNFSIKKIPKDFEG